MAYTTLENTLDQNKMEDNLKRCVVMQVTQNFNNDLTSSLWSYFSNQIIHSHIFKSFLLDNLWKRNIVVIWL